MKYFFVPGVQSCWQCESKPSKESPIKGEEVQNSDVNEQSVRFPAPCVVERVDARHPRDRVRLVRHGRPLIAATRLRQVNVPQPQPKLRRSVLSNGLPHFRFLVRRGIFVKL